MPHLVSYLMVVNLLSGTFGVRATYNKYEKTLKMTVNVM